ncbi:virB8 family protein [Burkholderia multivorans]|uniref:virB8 family protein n=1 Tax=Burkholderia multivorans TaxID=87883 RepID=UPI000751C43F|nr:type IV secretion system protein [Burkholderia multivorans]AOK67874.1 conjugal transfer protein TraJ [Burkholderia multivorans]KVZ75275.1 conjugal transfer protein TraJ [Burkholderia multivorans]
MTFLKHSTSTLDWEASIVQMQERSERRAWQVAKVASVIAVICAVAFASMVPFYRLIPLPIEVDRLTGDAQVIDVLDAKHVKLTKLVDKHWLSTYVQTRERYFWPFLQMDYDTVRAMSNGRAERDYEQIYAGPDALDKTLGPDIERRIKVLSTSLPPGEPGRAVVRFMRTTVDHGQIEQPECFLATIAYQYTPKVLQREREGTLNPLGFKVTAYSRDADYGVCLDSTASGATAPVSSPEVQR